MQSMKTCHRLLNVNNSLLSWGKGDILHETRHFTDNFSEVRVLKINKI